MRRIIYIALGSALLAAPLAAQTAPQTAPAAAPAATATPAQPNVTAGAAVSDVSGAPVGTIESVANGVATLSTGTTKAGIPVGSFAQGPNGLVLGMTRAQVDAQASAAQEPQFAIGAAVMGPKGQTVGTIKEMDNTTVTLTSDTSGTAKLPKSAFAQGPNGLVISLTPEQFEAAVKAAGGK